MEKVSKAWPNKNLVEKFLDKYSFWVVLVLSIPAVWALFVPGFYGASDDLHIAWLHQMDAVIRAGKFPPRYVPDLSFGFGYPLFNFVFPLPFYLGELFHLIGLSFVDSIKAVFVISVPLSMYFMFKFLRQFTSSLLALAGAVVYVFTPYRSTDIYVRGAIGECLAFVFIPLVFLSVIKVTEEVKNRVGWIGILGLSTAALLTSHNIMAYMFFPMALVLAFVRTLFHPTPRLPVILKTFLGFLLGLLISIYFWLPAVVESGIMKYSTVFDYIDHFPIVKQLVAPYFGYGASVPGPYDGMSFFIGTINIVLVFMGIVVLSIFRNKLSQNQTILLLWSLFAVGIAALMMNHRSTFLWDNLPLLPYFQFPWRFLSLVTFATPIFIIVLTKIKYSRYLGLGIIILAISLNFSYFKPHDFLGRADDYYINRYIPVPEASQEYLKTTEEYLRLPKATEERPNKVSPHRGLDASFEVDYGQEATFDYYKYYFPGWEAYVDGTKVTIKAGRPYGQIVFSVPQGKHKVEVRFRETPFRKVLNYVSLLSLIVAITIVLKGRASYEK